MPNGGRRLYFNETFTPVSGTADVHVYYTSHGGRAKIAGGQRIVSEYINKCVDEEILSAVKDETARNNLYEVDLTAYSAVLTPLYVHKQDAVAFDGVSFFADNDIIDFARWPNDGEVMPDNDESPIGIDSLRGFFITTYINFINEKGVIVTPTEEASNGNIKTSPMVIYLTPRVVERISTWDFSRDIYTHDYFSNNWDDAFHKITDFKRGPMMAINGFTYEGYIVTDRGRTYNSEMAAADGNGSSQYRRGYFINVLEEIDIPRECYYDYEDMKLYVYLTEKQVADGIYISTAEQLMSIDGAKNLTFRNIDFQYSQNSLISVANSKNISFVSVSVANASCDGISVDNTTDFTLRDSKIYNLGEMAVSITNCNKYSTESANILIENNHIFDMGQRRTTYNPALNVDSVSGIVVRKNTMNGGKHNAIQPKMLYDAIFEYNEVYDFVTETDDVGLFYSHGERDAMFGVVFRYNYIHDIGAKWQSYKIVIWYNDNSGLGYSAYGNIISNFAVGNNTMLCTITTSPRAAEFHDNLFFNMGEKFHHGADDTYAQLGNWWRSLANLSCPNDQNTENFLLPLISAKVLELDGNSVVPGKFESTEWAKDENRNFSYEHIKYLTSDKAKYDVYSSGIAIMENGGKWQDENGMSVINDDTVEMFELEVLSATNGVSAGTYTFDTSDALFQKLYQLGYKGESAFGTETYRLVYDGNYQVRELYFNIYEKDTNGGYRFSDIAKAVASQRGVSESDITLSTFNRSMSDTVALVAKYYFYGPVGYVGTLTRNVYINAYTLEGGEFKNYSSYFKSEQNTSIDGIDGDLFDEEGYYNIGVDDILYNLEFEIDLPDISEVGAKIN